MMRLMRTTVAIDDDLFDKLKESAARRRLPFTRIVNEALRRGLAAQRPRQARRTPFRIEPFDSAFRAGVDPLRLNQLVDDLYLRRLTEPREG